MAALTATVEWARQEAMHGWLHAIACRHSSATSAAACNVAAEWGCSRQFGKLLGRQCKGRERARPIWKQINERMLLQSVANWNQ